jgi:hypothetical protein
MSENATLEMSLYWLELSERYIIHLRVIYGCFSFFFLAIK